MTEKEAREKAERWTKSYVRGRLADGDNPIELSLEHWQDNEALLEAAGCLDPVGLTSGTHSCALCHLYWDTEHCDGCPLDEAGLCCLDPVSPYSQWKEAETFDQQLEATRALVKVLEGLIADREAFVPDIHAPEEEL